MKTGIISQIVDDKNNCVTVRIQRVFVNVLNSNLNTELVITGF